MIGLIVPVNSSLVPSGLGLRPARASVFSFSFVPVFFLPYSFLFAFFVLFCIVFFVLRVYTRYLVHIIYYNLEFGGTKEN